MGYTNILSVTQWHPKRYFPIHSQGPTLFYECWIKFARTITGLCVHYSLPLSKSSPVHITFHAAGECRQRVKNFTKYSKNDNVSEMSWHIWDHHGKCIQISTNITGIGSLIREIDVNISEIWESKHNSKTSVRVRSVKCRTRDAIEQLYPEGC